MLNGSVEFLTHGMAGLRRKPIFTVTLGLVCGAQCHGLLLFNAENAVADESVIAEYDVPTGGALPTLPVDIQGKRYSFWVGTDRTYWTFDDSLRSQIQPIDSRIAARSDGTTLFILPTASIGPFSVAKGSMAICTPLREEIAAGGTNVYGGIGFKFLGDKVFRIDFDRGKFTFLRRAGPECGQAFKLDVVDEGDGPRPLLTVELPTGPERFRICTSTAGFNAGSITHAKFATLLKQGSISLISDVGRKHFGIDPGTTRSGRLASFAVGDFRHEKLLFDDNDYSSLDLGYLSRYVITFDCPNRLIYLRSGKGYDRTDHEYNAGLTVVRARDFIAGGGDADIYGVVPGSAGEAAGLNDFDQIRSVDGQMTAQAPLFEIMRKFATPGRHDVIFVRGGKQMRTTIVIEDDLRELPFEQE